MGALPPWAIPTGPSPAPCCSTLSSEGLSSPTRPTWTQSGASDLAPDFARIQERMKFKTQERGDLKTEGDRGRSHQESPRRLRRRGGLAGRQGGAESSHTEQAGGQAEPCPVPRDRCGWLEKVSPGGGISRTSPHQGRRGERREPFTLKTTRATQRAWGDIIFWSNIV